MKLGVLILAGGKSSRMNGFDKSQLIYQNQTFLTKLCHEFQDFPYKYISDNQNRKHHHEGYITIVDEYQEIGPISGIVSTFHQTDVDYLFVIACDMPFITKDILLLLEKFIKCYDGVFLYNQQRLYPMGSIYSRKMLSVMEKHIQDKKYALMSCIHESHVLKLSLKELNIDEHIFDNINTMQDYKSINK